jgi:hypothetical protein
VGADEPLTSREIREKFADIKEDQKARDDRVAKLASEVVTAEAWGRENGHLQRGIAEVDAHCEERHKTTLKALDEVKSAVTDFKKSTQDALKELKSASEQQVKDLKSSIEKKSEFTWTRVLAIAAILATLAAAWYAALHQGGR